MPDILHRVGIKASPEKVYEALSTLEGIRHWWIVGTNGETKKGGIIDFDFCKMKVVKSEPKKVVQWTCVQGPREWMGTEVMFRLKWKDGQTFVVFKHGKWKRPDEFMHHCSTKWAVFLLSLRDWLERSEGRPAPYDMKISADD